MPTKEDLKRHWKWVPFRDIQDKKNGIKVVPFSWTSPGFYNIDYVANHKWGGKLYTHELRDSIILDIQNGAIVLSEGPIAKDPDTGVTWQHPKGGLWREFIWDVNFLKNPQWFEPIDGPRVMPPNKPLNRDGYPIPFYARILCCPYDIEGFPPLLLDLDKT